MKTYVFNYFFNSRRISAQYFVSLGRIILWEEINFPLKQTRLIHNESLEIWLNCEVFKRIINQA